jgi:hypothetical protein
MTGLAIGLASCKERATQAESANRQINDVQRPNKEDSDRRRSQPLRIPRETNRPKKNSAPKGAPLFVRFQRNSPAVGDSISSTTIYDEKGQPFDTDAFKGSFTVLVFGCLTCPPFLHNVRSLEAVYQDYAPKGVAFYYIYRTLAHPQWDGYVAPFTLKERLKHIREAKRRLGTRIPWLSDNMGNELKRALGDAWNSEFIVDPHGRIVRKRLWSIPDELRSELERLIGPVESPTLPSDVHINPQPPPKRAARGVVPRVDPPARTLPLKVAPKHTGSEIPYYAKLRAEIDRGFFGAGEGKLYLGFHLDPLYRVHWNNRAKPIRFEIQAPEGIVVSPNSGEGPEVDADADADPREFLLDVKTDGSEEPIELKVYYFACDDDQTFCVPVTQGYDIRLEHDSDAGESVWSLGSRRQTAM